MITPEHATILREAIENALLDVHVALPGKVQSYREATKTADVEVMIKRLLPDGEGDYVSEELPVLQNVRVMLPAAGGFFLSLPLQAGDTGLLVFNEASISQWRATGRLADPEDIGRHNISSPVFLPGFLDDIKSLSTISPVPGAACLFNAAGHIALNPAGIVTVNNGNLTVLP